MAEKFHSDDWDKKYNEWQEKKKKVRNEPKSDKPILNKSEPIIKKPSKDESSMRKFEDTLELKRGPRWEKIVILIIYLIVLNVAFYFILAGIAPERVPFRTNEYTINAGDMQLFSNLNSFYIDKNVLGGKEVIDKHTVRKIISAEPFNFVFSPKLPVKNDTNATLTIQFYNVSTDVYLNDKLIIPDLSNYTLVKSFDNEDVYLNKNYSYSNLSLKEADSAGEFVYKNFPGAKVYSFSDSNYEPILSDYNKSWTSLGTTFRDNLKLAVYAEGTLEARFTKEDLNWYVGKDEYNVTITDFSGKIIYNKLFEDDGNTGNNDKLGKEQDFQIKIDNLPMGIYYISFIKDKYNSASDSTLNNIKINSNKILILEEFLSIEIFKFYTHVDSFESLSFYYWWEDKDQNIKINNRVINLDNQWMSKKYTENLSLGDYNVSLEKGYLWVYSKFVSPKKENWFYLPIKPEKNLANLDILIIDKNKLKIRGDSFIYSEDVSLNKNSKFKLQIIDKTMTRFESAKLELK